MGNTKNYHIGWFSTGRDEAARALLTAVHEAIRRHEIKAAIDFVFLSREYGESEESDCFIRLVKSYHIPIICFSYQRFKTSLSLSGKPQSASGFPQWRLDYDRKAMSLLKNYQPDLCILAGYMLIVGPEMCTHFDMINLHPAAPDGPTGTWQDVIWQLIKQQAKETGVMMHLVTPELDRGPVVSYCRFSIRGGPFDPLWADITDKDIDIIKDSEGENNPLFKFIRQQGLKREFPMIISTIKAFSEGRVRLSNGQVTGAGGNILQGYDLTTEIDRLVGQP